MAASGAACTDRGGSITNNFFFLFFFSSFSFCAYVLYDTLFLSFFFLTNRVDMRSRDRGVDR